MSGAPASLTLYLVRHGETDWNAERRYQGQRNIPLNARGRSQASDNGRRLAGLVPGLGDLDFQSSPLERARETMELLRDAAGLPATGYTIDDRLREVSYGHWEGQLADDLAATDPGGVTARRADPFNWQPRGGESYAELTQRVAGWLECVRRDSVVVTHGGVVRALHGALFGLAPAEITGMHVAQDVVFVLERTGASWTRRLV
jgi:probable phosphoglycerate mutase